MIPEGLTEPDVLIGQRCFPDAEALFALPVAQVLGAYTVGWHDTFAQPYRGNFAVVSDAVPEVADLVGETLRIGARGLSVNVYVLGRAEVPHRISLARRAFLALSGLYRDDVSALVWRLEPLT